MQTSSILYLYRLNKTAKLSGVISHITTDIIHIFQALQFTGQIISLALDIWTLKFCYETLKSRVKE